MNGAARETSGAALRPVASVAGLALRLVRHWWPQLAALAAALGAVRAVAARGGRDEFGRADWGAPGAWSGDELLVGLVV